MGTTFINLYILFTVNLWLLCAGRHRNLEYTHTLCIDAIWRVAVMTLQSRGSWSFARRRELWFGLFRLGFLHYSVVWELCLNGANGCLGCFHLWHGEIAFSLLSSSMAQVGGAMGWVSMEITVGPVLGPFIGGILWVFFILGLIAEWNGLANGE